MKQHYVPVMYTKAWVDPEAPQRHLWCYRPDEWPRRKGPAAVGYWFVHCVSDGTDLMRN